MGSNVTDDNINEPKMTFIEKQMTEAMEKKQERSPLRLKLENWLNKNMKIEMTDGRVLVGIFLCTDRDRNVILGSCAEYLNQESEAVEEPRVLGLAMVPGHHIVSIQVDADPSYTPEDAL